MRTLLLGGVRSGKSRRAHALGAAFEDLSREHEVTLIATALAHDEEMRVRIESHRRVRPRSWRTIEEPLHLGSVLRGIDDPPRLVIIDCLTLWLTNLLLDRDPCAVRIEVAAFLSAIKDARAEIILVSNETGLGNVPNNALGRRFNDEAGELHQALAAICERVELLIAGIPLVVKPRVAVGREGAGCDSR